MNQNISCFSGRKKKECERYFNRYSGRYRGNREEGVVRALRGVWCTQIDVYWRHLVVGRETRKDDGGGDCRAVRDLWPPDVSEQRRQSGIGQ